MQAALGRGWDLWLEVFTTNSNPQAKAQVAVWLWASYFILFGSLLSYVKMGISNKCCLICMVIGEINEMPLYLKAPQNTKHEIWEESWLFLQPWVDFAFQLAVSEDLIFLTEVLQWNTLALEMFITTGHVEHISSLYVLWDIIFRRINMMVDS